jgi:uncharacterized protein (DUF885 family)
MSATGDLAAELLSEALHLDPCAAVLDAGVDDISDLTDFSPAGHEARAEFARSAQKRLSSLRPEGHADALLRDHLLERMESRLNMNSAGEQLRELNVALTGPLQMISQTVQAAVPGSASGADHARGWAQVALRLDAVPTALASYTNGLRCAADRGHVAAARQIDEAIRRCAGWAEEANGLVETYGDGVLATDLSAAAKATAVAYGDFESFLTTELGPRASAQEAFGPERYPLWVRHFLGVDPDLRDLYDWGWEGVHSLDRELARELRDFVPGGTLADAIERLDGPGGAGQMPTQEAFAGWLQHLLDDTMARLDGVHFTIPEPIRRLESGLTKDASIFYIAPSQDLSRPGRVSWSIDDGPPYPTWAGYSIAFHEGVPGHHLQLGLAAHRGDTLSQRLGVLGGLSACHEGWALYAETLMDELGFFIAPGARLGFLLSQMLRAVRVVIDIGLHLRLRLPAGSGLADGDVWTPRLALQMLTERAFQGPSAEAELVRYLGRPGQALAYKAGERVYLDVRNEVKAAKGADFDLAQFHDAVLSVGGAGLGHLKTELARVTA